MKSAIVKVETQAVQSQNIMSAELVESFINFAGVSEKSAATYKIALRQMFKYFSVNSIEKPKRCDLENWREELKSQKKSASTIMLYLTACKIFFRWLAQENIYLNIADHLKSGVKKSYNHKKDALTNTQAGKLIRSVEGTDEKSRRDRAVIALMATAGLRCIEVIRADVGDMIEQYGRVYLLVQGKGHSQKDARVLVPAQVVKLIRDYLETRKDLTTDAPLFTSTANRNKGSRLSTQTISKTVKANLRAIGLDSRRLSAHSLRHTAITTMILAGCDLADAQVVARHAQISTTMIYNNAVQRMKITAEQIAADSIFDTISA